MNQPQPQGGNQQPPQGWNQQQAQGMMNQQQQQGWNQQPLQGWNQQQPQGLGGPPPLGTQDVLDELESIRIILAAPHKFQTISNATLQISGLLAAAIFGVFSILAWSLASTANSIASKALAASQAANTIALLSYCDSSNDSGTTQICNRVLSQAFADLSNITGIAYIFPQYCFGNDCPGNATENTGQGTVNTSNGLSPGAIGGIVVGSIIAVIWVFVLPISLQTGIYKEKKKRAGVARPAGAEVAEKAEES